MYDAASHRTGGVRSFPASSDESVWLQYAYDAPDRVHTNLWSRHVDSHRGIQPNAAAKPAAGWVIPHDEDCHPFLVAHSILAAVWLLREMLPTAMPDNSWQQLVNAAQAISARCTTPSPPPSTQRPTAVPMEDSDAAAGAEPDSDSD